MLIENANGISNCARGADAQKQGKLKSCGEAPKKGSCDPVNVNNTNDSLKGGGWLR